MEKRFDEVVNEFLPRHIMPGQEGREGKAMVEVTVKAKASKWAGVVYTATVTRPYNHFHRIGCGNSPERAVADLTAKLKAKGVNLDNVNYNVLMK